jgi:hypothetical protein
LCVRKPFEAFELLQSTKVVQRARAATRRDAYDRLVRLTAAHCGFARFADAHFDEARRFFLDAHLDAVNLLCFSTCASICNRRHVDAVRQTTCHRYQRH